MKKVLVIGAGITGLTTAYYLKQQEFDVTVIDRENGPAMKCSYANGGQISVSNSEVWNSWSNVFKGAKWMFKKDAPLLIRPSLDIDKIVWLTKFLYHTATSSYEKNTLATIAMGLDAQKKYRDIRYDHDLDFDQSDCGILHIYRNKKALEDAKKLGQLYGQSDVSWEMLSARQTREMVYGLKGDISGGCYTKTDWTGDIFKFCTNFKEVLKEQGVTFWHGRYEDMDKTMFEYYIGGPPYDYIVVCAGTGSRQLSKYIGDKLPIYPVKGYSITIEEKCDTFDLPSVSIIDDEAKIVTSTFGDRLRVAGTAEFDGYNEDIRRDRIDPLLKWTRRTLGIHATKYSSWSCLRPMTPNMLPIVSQSKKNPKVFYNTGHGHLGWTLAPHTADQIAKKIKAYDRYKQ